MHSCHIVICRYVSTTQSEQENFHQQDRPTKLFLDGQLVSIATKQMHSRVQRLIISALKADLFKANAGFLQGQYGNYEWLLSIPIIDHEWYSR